MFLEIILAITMGVLAGTVTGLIPGVHINLISMVLLSLSSFFLGFTNEIVLITFITSMSITHSFLDVIPSTYLGAPDPSTALLALPAHKFLLSGRGFEAIYLTLIGSFLSLLFSIILLPLVFLFLTKFYSFFKNNVFFIILFFSLYLVIKSKSVIKTSFVFLLSGLLGYLVLNNHNLVNPLLPMFSGLFGTSMLITSYFDEIRIPKQKISFPVLNNFIVFKTISKSFLAGFLTSFLPGLGSSQGAAIASSFGGISDKNNSTSCNDEDNIVDSYYLIMIGGINTVNFFLSIIAFFIIGKARNGSIIAISKLVPTFSIGLVIYLILVSIISASISLNLTLRISGFFSKIFLKLNYKKLVLSIILFVSFLSVFLSNGLGLVVYLASISLGLISNHLSVPRSFLMGCLLIPVMVFLFPF